MGLQKGSIRSFFYALRKPNLKAMTKHKTQNTKHKTQNTKHKNRKLTKLLLRVLSIDGLRVYGFLMATSCLFVTALGECSI